MTTPQTPDPRANQTGPPPEAQTVTSGAGTTKPTAGDGTDPARDHLFGFLRGCRADVGDPAQAATKLIHRLRSLDRAHFTIDPDNPPAWLEMDTLGGRTKAADLDPDLKRLARSPIVTGDARLNIEIPHWGLRPVTYTGRGRRTWCRNCGTYIKDRAAHTLFHAEITELLAKVPTLWNAAMAKEQLAKPQVKITADTSQAQAEVESARANLQDHIERARTAQAVALTEADQRAGSLTPAEVTTAWWARAFVAELILQFQRKHPHLDIVTAADWAQRAREDNVRILVDARDGRRWATEYPPDNVMVTYLFTHPTSPDYAANRFANMLAGWPIIHTTAPGALTIRSILQHDNDTVTLTYSLAQQTARTEPEQTEQTFDPKLTISAPPTPSRQADPGPTVHLTPPSELPWWKPGTTAPWPQHADDMLGTRLRLHDTDGNHLAATILLRGDANNHVIVHQLTDPTEHWVTDAVPGDDWTSYASKANGGLSTSAHPAGSTIVGTTIAWPTILWTMATGEAGSTIAFLEAFARHIRTLTDRARDEWAARGVTGPRTIHLAIWPVDNPVGGVNLIIRYALVIARDPDTPDQERARDAADIANAQPLPTGEGRIIEGGVTWPDLTLEGAPTVLAGGPGDGTGDDITFVTVDGITAAPTDAHEGDSPHGDLHPDHAGTDRPYLRGVLGIPGEPTSETKRDQANEHYFTSGWDAALTHAAELINKAVEQPQSPIGHQTHNDPPVDLGHKSEAFVDALAAARWWDPEWRTQIADSLRRSVNYLDYSVYSIPVLPLPPVGDRSDCGGAPTADEVIGNLQADAPEAWAKLDAAFAEAEGVITMEPPCPRCHNLAELGALEAKRDKARKTGTSSNALVRYAFGFGPRPAPDQGTWCPQDRGDLGRCEFAYDNAPPHIQQIMLPVMQEFRAYVEAKYPTTDPAPAPTSGFKSVPVAEARQAPITDDTIRVAVLTTPGARPLEAWSAVAFAPDGIELRIDTAGSSTATLTLRDVADLDIAYISNVGTVRRTYGRTSFRPPKVLFATTIGRGPGERDRIADDLGRTIEAHVHAIGVKPTSRVRIGIWPVLEKTDGDDKPSVTIPYSVVILDTPEDPVSFAIPDINLPPFTCFPRPSAARAADSESRTVTIQASGDFTPEEEAALAGRVEARISEHLNPPPTRRHLANTVTALLGDAAEDLAAEDWKIRLRPADGMHKIKGAKGRSASWMTTTGIVTTHVDSNEVAVTAAGRTWHPFQGPDPARHFADTVVEEARKLTAEPGTTYHLVLWSGGPLDPNLATPGVAYTLTAVAPLQPEATAPNPTKVD